MADADIKARWLAAKAVVDEIDAERAALLAPTNERYAAAQAALGAIEEEADTICVGRCEGCDTPIFDGERSHSGDDYCLCAECAPSWADMLASPGVFLDNETGEPMTPERAAALVEAHVAAGGSADDKMVW